MNTPHTHASGAMAGKGVLLTILAVVLGTFLLARGFDGSGDMSWNADGNADTTTVDGEGSAGGEPSETPTGDATGMPVGAVPSTTTTQPPVVTQPPLDTRPPNEIKVAAVNGTGIRGLAAGVADRLNAGNYITEAKNAAKQDLPSTKIYYREGYADDAKVVADVLQVTADLLTPTSNSQTLTTDNVLTSIGDPDNVRDFHIYILLGLDCVVTPGVDERCQ